MLFFVLFYAPTLQSILLFFILNTKAITNKNIKRNLLLMLFIYVITSLVARQVSQMENLLLFILFFGLSLSLTDQKSVGQRLFEVVFSIMLPNLIMEGFSKVSVLFQFPLLILVVSTALISCFGYFVNKVLLNRLPKKGTEIFGYLLTITFVGDSFYNLYNYLLEYPEEFRFQTMFIVLIVLAVLLILIGMVTFFFISANQKMELEAQKEALKYEALTTYTAEISQQYQEIRKFRHDYMNLLVGMEGFLEDEDLKGLRDFYYTSIAPTRNLLSKNDLRLSDLQRIKNEEIRSLFIAKLVLAQQKGVQITIEVPEEVELQTDLVVLLRILGILLDNAIEELVSLHKGLLEVAFLNLEATILIVIQNTVREDLPPLYQLKQTGFSTKGNNRGLGLSNVDDLLKRNPQLLLESTIETGKFIQKLTIVTEAEVSDY